MSFYSKIKLTFNSDLTNESIAFDFGDLGGGFITATNEEWVPVRYGASMVNQGTPTATAGERSAINYANSFDADYNNSGVFKIEVEDNEVTITSTRQGIDFDNGSVSAPAAVDIEITAATDVPLAINDVSFGASTPVCENVDVIVTASKQADAYSINGGPQVPVTQNPFTFQYARATGMHLTLHKATEAVTQIVATPTVIFSSGISVTVDFVPSGSLVSVSVTQPSPQVLNFAYSMDGTNYQSSPNFSGVLEGNYTMYVKDQFGCVTTKVFEVGIGGLQLPFFAVSKSNSIRYAYRVNWGDSANYKNDDNTLSGEADVPVPWTQIQLFQSSDIIKTQFRSNYPVNVAEVHTQGTTQIVNPVVNQLTENMGLKDRRDARKYNYGNGKTGVYFLAGNIYDFDTGQDIGDYTLNGAVPEWALPGNHIFLGDGAGGGTWHIIEDVLFDENKACEVVIVNDPFLDVDSHTQVRSIYNRHNFEVYEFEVDMAIWLDKVIHVKILASGTGYPSVEYQSEEIEVRVRHLRTIDITYFNRNNTDLLFDLGLRCRIRPLLEAVSGKPITETSAYKSDTTSSLLDSSLHEADLFEFQPMTKQMMLLAVRALIHSNVTMDGVEYVTDSIEVSEALGETNLYDLKATMIKASDTYNSNSGVVEFAVGNIEIPALIGGGNDFVKYQ